LKLSLHTPTISLRPRHRCKQRFLTFFYYFNVYLLKKRSSKFEDSTKNVEKGFKCHTNELVGYSGGSLLT